MIKEELIKKWLDHSLTAEEQSAFERLDDFEQLQKLDAKLKSIKSPEFNTEEGYKQLKKQIESDSSGMRWFNKILRVAAVLVLGLSIFYVVMNRDTSVSTELAQITNVVLPDGSVVDVNANSEIRYNKWFWDSERLVSLEGEAFFKVSKGQKFEVETIEGVVSVLGTEFNVKHRQGIFEVVCYEGKVSVSHKMNSAILTAGDALTVINGKLIAKEKKMDSEPTWLNGESSFESTPLAIVLQELQNQYNVDFNTKSIDTERLFTGSFTNSNLELALKSICVPLDLTYTISGNTILFKGE